MGRNGHSKTGKKYVDEVASTAVLAGVGAYMASGISFLDNVRESLYNARHAGKTIVDAAQGGPEGMRAAENLESALDIVTKSTESNGEARKALQSYVLQRKDLVGELGKAYRENETVAQVAGRLELQLSGFLKNYFEMGNAVKGKNWKGIDDAIMKLYGQNPIEAREKSGNLGRFYKEVREFYDAREKNEHTVKEFCDHLREIQTDSLAQNEKFNELFPQVISRVKEGYENEDLLIDSNRNKSELTHERVDKIDEMVGNFRGKVDKTYETVGKEMPIKSYNESNWVDVATNPITIGIAGALLIKGVSRLVGFGGLVNKVVAAPVVYPAKGVIGLSRKVFGKSKKLKTLNNLEGVEGINE